MPAVAPRYYVSTGSRSAFRADGDNHKPAAVRDAAEWAPQNRTDSPSTWAAPPDAVIFSAVVPFADPDAETLPFPPRTSRANSPLLPTCPGALRLVYGFVAEAGPELPVDEAREGNGADVSQSARRGRHDTLRVHRGRRLLPHPSSTHALDDPFGKTDLEGRAMLIKMRWRGSGVAGLQGAHFC